MTCRFCIRPAVRFEPRPKMARKLKGLRTTAPGEFEGIAYCAKHQEKFNPSRITGIKAAEKYLKRKGRR